MPNPLDISLELSVGAANPVAPIDISLDPEITDCGCDTDCDTQDLLVIKDKPPVGVPPVFIPPTVSIYSLSNPVPALLPTQLHYILDYTKRDGGTVTSVLVRVDGIAVHTGGLTGSFTRVLSPGLHTATFEVTYGPGTVGQDSNGNPVPNPITGSTLTVSIAFNAIIPLYSGVGEVPVTFTNPQIQDLKLNTGTIETRFWLAIHNTLTLQTAEDSNAMYLDLKGIFVYYSTVSISGESYIVYRMVNAIPYKTSHKFEFHVN